MNLNILILGNRVYPAEINRMCELSTVTFIFPSLFFSRGWGWGVGGGGGGSRLSNMLVLIL